MRNRKLWEIFIVTQGKLNYFFQVQCSKTNLKFRKIWRWNQFFPSRHQVFFNQKIPYYFCNNSIEKKWELITYNPWIFYTGIHTNLVSGESWSLIKVTYLLIEAKTFAKVKQNVKWNEERELGSSKLKWVN